MLRALKYEIPTKMRKTENVLRWSFDGVFHSFNQIKIDFLSLRLQIHNSNPLAKVLDVYTYFPVAKYPLFREEIRSSTWFFLSNTGFLFFFQKSKLKP